MRVVIGDYKRKISRSIIDTLTKWATPAEWAKYPVTSTVIKLYNKSDTKIANLLRNAAYENDIFPKRAKFIERSRLKVGCQTILIFLPTWILTVLVCLARTPDEEN
jgi:hypothetical protein